MGHDVSIQHVMLLHDGAHAKDAEADVEADAAALAKRMSLASLSSDLESVGSEGMIPTSSGHASVYSAASPFQSSSSSFSSNHEATQPLTNYSDKLKFHEANFAQLRVLLRHADVDKQKHAFTELAQVEGIVLKLQGEIDGCQASDDEARQKRRDLTTNCNKLLDELDDELKEARRTDQRRERETDVGVRDAHQALTNYSDNLKSHEANFAHLCVLLRHADVDKQKRTFTELAQVEGIVIKLQGEIDGCQVSDDEARQKRRDLTTKCNKLLDDLDGELKEATRTDQRR